MNLLLAGGIGSSVLGTVLYVVGIATPAWLSAEQQGKKLEMGLWEICGVSSGAWACISYPDISRLSGAVHATRAFAIIGSLLLFAGLSLVGFAAMKNIININLNVSILKKIGGALIITGGICGVLAAGIFTGDSSALTHGLPVPFGYSIYLTWAQAVFTLGGGAVIIAAARQSQQEDEIPVLSD
ncbi:claudin-7-A-like [Branchiostoma floridae x Branchiostoma japonicum]